MTEITDTSEAQSVQDETQESLREVQWLLARSRQAEDQADPQHLAALCTYLESLPDDRIARVLEALSPEDSITVWDQVAVKRGSNILDELSDVVSEVLTATPARPIRLNAFELQSGRLQQVRVSSRRDLAATSPIWIDLIAPSRIERQWIKELFDLVLPDTDDLTDLEESARFYIDDNGEVHLHSNFLLDTEAESRNVAVAMILHKNILFTVRDEELPVFRLQRLRARIQPGYVTDGTDLLLDLYAADVEYAADALESVYASLEEVGKRVLAPNVSDTVAATILADIAREEDLNGRIRRNVLDTRRALSFLMRGRLLTTAQYEESRQILRDIDSLDSHTAFIFGKINFLMDATVGFININQNKVIKIFSVASVAMLPPTLIASIYGMNFKFMPELGSPLGYPFAILLMAVSVGAPFWYFNKKGWLR
ncbi:MAG: magnesium/cobalt transporter CorA [Georgfuchsia sp.]